MSNIKKYHSIFASEQLIYYLIVTKQKEINNMEKQNKLQGVKRADIRSMAVAYGLNFGDTTEVIRELVAEMPIGKVKEIVQRWLDNDPYYAEIMEEEYELND